MTQAADARGFVDLYQQVAPALRVWAGLRLRPTLRSYCDLEDLLQEIWFRAYSIRERFDPATTPFRPWIFRVAKNVLLEVVQRAESASRVTNPEGRTSRVLQLEAIADRVTSITRKVTRDDTLQAFHARIEALPTEERELVLHIGLEGMPQAAAAQRLGLSHEAVKKRWQRLRSKLDASSLPDLLSE